MMVEIISPSIILTAAMVSFISELGDKSQIMIIALAARNRNLLPIFSGALVAEIGMNGLGIVAGTLLSFTLPYTLLNLLAGILFVALGVMTIIRKKDEKIGGVVGKSIGFWSAFSLVSVSEVGDKTQVSSFALAAEYNSPLSILLGFAIAISMLTLSSTLIGVRASRILPLRWIRIVSGLLFLAFGAVFLFGASSII